jgi:hypothetical protein
MSVQINQPGITVKATAVVTARKLIKWDGTLCGLDAVRNWVGVSQEPRAIGEQIPVRLPTAGTVILTASETIAAGDILYKAANGLVSKTATSSVAIGMSLEAAVLNGEFQAIINPA